MSGCVDRGVANVVALSLAAGLALALIAPSAARAAALTGSVSAGGEPALEGVLVTVRQAGSPIATTVVSDAAGRYAFPDNRLAPGRYAVAIRAVGFELDSPRTLELGPAGGVVRLRLRRTGDLAPQLTNSEWLASLPGTPAEKRQFSACATCHPLTLPLESAYTASELRERIAWMAGMSSQAMPGLVQRKAVPDPPSTFGDVDHLAEYIASLNRSPGPHPKLTLHGFERPRGAATRVVITAYELPRRTMQPHDAVRGDDGYVWISDFGENSLLRLDPQTGAVREYPYAPPRPGPYANGNLDLEFDPQGGLWLAMMNQTGIARFDRRSGEFTFHPIPETLRDESTQTSMVEPLHSSVDGKIWVQAVLKPQITRFDTRTGRYEDWRLPFESLPGFHAAYGVYTDSANNAYLCDFQSRYIVQIDARTGKVRYFATPTEHSRPRRGRMDRLDRLWFAEWWVDQVAMFDTHSGAFTEWTIPGYMPEPYDAELDAEGWVWTDNMMDDRVTRLDSKTGRTIQYLMPIPTNARRVAVDNSGARPVLWVGANHEAAVLKVEPLD